MNRRKFIIQGILAGVGLVLLDSLWFEKYIIDWNTFDLSKGRADKIKIAQLSDLHLKKLRSVHHSIARKLKDWQPDLIMITGDAIDNAQNLDLLNTFLNLLPPSTRKFAITGNWEYWSKVDLNQLQQLYRQYNGELLINTHQTLSIRQRTLNIIGIDDLLGGQPDFKTAIQNLSPADTNIILNHCPEYNDTIAQQKEDLKIDLLLSGHTHGGQISLLGWAPFTPRGSGRYLKGWYHKNDLPLYVSKGIGTSVLPFRFGSRAEVTLFTL